MEYTINGKIEKVNHDLVDYIADGFILTDNDKIPCEVGFVKVGKDIEAKYIFTQSGITEKGTAYYPMTIDAKTWTENEEV